MNHPKDEPDHAGRKPGGIPVVVGSLGPQALLFLPWRSVSGAYSSPAACRRGRSLPKAPEAASFGKRGHGPPAQFVVFLKVEMNPA
jgi:hypothetical protein